MNARRLRSSVVVVAAAIVLPTFALIEGESVDARGLAALVPTIWWLAPFLLYVRDLRTMIGSAGIGVTLLVATVVGVNALYQDDRSTAAIGFVTIPLLLGAIVIGASLGERVVLRLRAKK
jgi:hypothetical protein